MRSDALGFFWEDRPVIKVLKEPPPKRVPPEPLWLRPDYLPGLDEALAFPVALMDDAELMRARDARERLVYDTEVYQNYFCAAFMSTKTGRVAYLEMFETEQGVFVPLDINRLGWIMTNFTLLSFNGIGFDIPIVSLALAGKTPSQLKGAANRIIQEQLRPADVLRSMRVRSIREYVDHIDLMEVAPLTGSLKTYGGRMHVPRMQDLPFHHASVLSSKQMAIVRWYCVNDLTQTAFLDANLKEQIQLREQMTQQYGVDLRSKSDAQVAEAVIGHEIEKLNRERPQRPEIPIGTSYRYKVPHFLRFETPLMNWAMGIIANARFVVGDFGSIEMPKEIGELKLTIADNVYRMGIGGLHSSETSVAIRADADTLLLDRDVTSYYPAIILNLGLFPPHLGRNFLRVYKTIVDRRIAAKESGNKVVADSLKITVNGSFGKLGSKWSILYSPDLMIQVTITGQLCLLMLVERMEVRGIKVISANTDGVVIQCPKARHAEVEWLIKEWERETGFSTEESRYSAYYARDVNNYIAVKVPDKDGKIKTKTKGVFAETGLSKNPTNRICVDAVEALLTKNVAIRDTIRNCKDIRKFISVRKVKGGAVKVYTRKPPPPHNTKEELLKIAGYSAETDPVSAGMWRCPVGGEFVLLEVDAAYERAKEELSVPANTEYLGVTIRWYYAAEQKGEIVYTSNGNKVPRSDGAKPCMTLPTEFPDDVDFEWYENESNKMLREVGYLEP